MDWWVKVRIGHVDVKLKCHWSRLWHKTCVKFYYCLYFYFTPLIEPVDHTTGRSTVYTVIIASYQFNRYGLTVGNNRYVVLISYCIHRMCTQYCTHKISCFQWETLDTVVQLVLTLKSLGHFFKMLFHFLMLFTLCAIFFIGNWFSTMNV